jgi:hypothetical protein
MPEEGMSAGGMPPQGGGAPQPQGQATGATPATMPVPNRGIEAAAMARLGVHVQGMQMVLAMLPAGSDAASAIRDALNKVAKFVPPGGMSQGVQITEQQRQLMQQKQMGPQIAAQRAAMMGGQPGQPQAPAAPQAPPQMAA